VTFERRPRRGSLGAALEICFQVAELKSDSKTRKDTPYKDGIDHRRSPCPSAAAMVPGRASLGYRALPVLSRDPGWDDLFGVPTCQGLGPSRGEQTLAANRAGFWLVRFARDGRVAELAVACRCRGHAFDLDVAVLPKQTKTTWASLACLAAAVVGRTDASGIGRAT